MRYLQDCIEKLKAQRGDSGPETPTNLDDTQNDRFQKTYDPDSEYHETAYTPEEEEQHSPDIEMTGSDEAISPTFATYPPSVGNASYHSTESPSLTAQDSTTSPVIHSHGSHSSISTAVEHHRHYSFSTTTVSPAFGPQQNPVGAGWYVQSSHSASASTLTSPALGPLRERDLDQEATAALLMLNSDRRGHVSTLTRELNNSESSRTPKGKPRGMSVKDLLSA